jgi:hypothetical protein
MPLASSTVATLLLALAFAMALSSRVCHGPAAAPAAQTSDEKLNAILEDIDKKTDQYAKFGSFLSDPDQARRMAAFSAMTDSGIPALQEMALDHVLSSDDSDAIGCITGPFDEHQSLDLSTQVIRR